MEDPFDRPPGGPDMTPWLGALATHSRDIH